MRDICAVIDLVELTELGRPKMTLVAVWRHAPGRIHAIADTRISGTGQSVLTDHGPKILPLTMVCRIPGPSHFIDKEIFRAEFGFAYAGSTLSALSTHALANVLCSNLGGLPAPVPSLDQVAYAIGPIAYRYMKEIESPFRAIIFGHCPQTQQALAFEFQPRTEPGNLILDIKKHALDDSTVVVLGTKPETLRERIAEVRANASHPIVYADAPMIALKGLIAESVIPGVGGSVQQAWAHSGRLEIIATAEAIVPVPPSTTNMGLYVLGFEMSEIQTIGQYHIVLSGRM
jgi:hypothetical protein